MDHGDLPSATAIASAFGLRGRVDSMVPVAGAWSNRVFRVVVGGHAYAVKEMVELWREPTWFERVDEAWTVECAALDAGIPAPQPVPNPADQGWRAEVERNDGSGPVSVRVHRWVEADVVPGGVAPVELATWSGSVLARLHLLDLRPRRPELFPPWSTKAADRWPALVEAAGAAGVSWAELAQQASPAVATIRAMATHHSTSGDEPMSHRDIDQKNVLVAAPGPVLCDWDVAGPVVPRQELIDVALSMARWESPSVARAVIDAYRRAGGDDTEIDPSDLAPMMLSSVLWLVMNVERALGLADAGLDQQRLGQQLVPDLLSRLSGRLEHAARIGEWLRS